MINARIKFLLRDIKSKIKITKVGNFDWKNVSISIISLFIIIILSINIANVIKNGTDKYNLLKQEVDKLNELIAQNEKLKEDLQYKKSDDYILKISLNQLNLVYPNSKIYLIKGVSDLDYVDVKKEIQKGKKIEKNNLEMWYDVFLKW